VTAGVPAIRPPARATGAAHAARPQRMRHLDELLGLLYPAPCTTRQRSSATVRDPVAEYLVVPSARRPRLLVPAHDRRLAAEAVRRWQPRSRLARLGRDALLAALRTGVSALLFRDRIRVTGAVGAPLDTIERYLAEALTAELRLSLHLDTGPLGTGPLGTGPLGTGPLGTGPLGTGPRGAGRPGAGRRGAGHLGGMPVLQLLSPEGETLGFAKLGTTAVTRTRVRDEANALVALGLAGLTQVTVPTVRHTGVWREHVVAVQSALPTWRPRVPLSATRLGRAMYEVAVCCGTRRGPFAESGYATRLRAHLDAVQEHPAGLHLAGAAARISAAAGAVPLEYGAWHGSWTPWSMACLDDTLLVWDWERFTPGVPLGFDALHHDLQRRLAAGDVYAAVDGTLDAAPVLLRAFGVTDADEIRLTGLLYLVELATRDLDAGSTPGGGTTGSGARPGAPGGWLLPALLDRVAAL